jgi:adenosylmethionine-8-amino-7-oxononanoate aminotransferase
LIGIELVAERGSRKPVSAALGLPLKIRNLAMDNGLICYPGGGTADGVDGAHILLAPPFIYRENHVSELIDKLSATLSGVCFDG